MPKQQQNGDDDRNKKLDLVLNEPQRNDRFTHPAMDGTLEYLVRKKKQVRIHIQKAHENLELVVIATAAVVSLRREDDEGRLPAL